MAMNKVNGFYKDELGAVIYIDDGSYISLIHSMHNKKHYRSSYKNHEFEDIYPVYFGAANLIDACKKICSLYGIEGIDRYLNKNE